MQLPDIMDKPFRFKQFTVQQDQCAMKIGTDGVLLASWAAPHIPDPAILDIGTGTGVISLILSQRFSNAQVEALEIDDKAYEQAVSNFENSPWADRLFCYHASFQEYFTEVDDTKYDLIISNPPFFSPSQMSPDHDRNIARFQNALPFDHLLHGTSMLLSDQGIAAFIIPFSEEHQFLAVAEEMHLFPNKITHVRGNAEAPVKRSLLQLSFQPSSTIVKDSLIIEESRHQYTDAYTHLVKDFYLNM